MKKPMQCMGFSFLCGRGDLNPHTLRRYHLKIVRLPFRHSRNELSER
jgi:hypothetical protein